MTSFFAAIDQSAFPFSVTEFNTVMPTARGIADVTTFVNGSNLFTIHSSRCHRIEERGSRGGGGKGEGSK